MSHPKTVVFVELWPGIYSSWKNLLLKSNISLDVVGYVLKKIRLLALIYDHIYIPIAHITTHPHNVHKEIVTLFLRHHDINSLIEAGVIVFSSKNNLDFIDAINFYKERTHNNWKEKSLPDSYFNNLPTPRILDIETTSQSVDVQGKLLSYYDYIHSNVEKRDYDSLIRVTNDSEAKGELPFYHEIFLANLLKSDIHKDLVDYIVKETNTYYMEVSCYGVPDSVSYYLRGAESKSARCTGDGYDSRLTGPELISDILGMWFDLDEYCKFFDAPIAVYMKFLGLGDSYRKMLRDEFIAEYFEGIKRFGEYVKKRKNIILLKDADYKCDDNYEDFLEYYVLGDSSNIIDAGEMFLTGAAAVYDPTAGVASRTAAKTTKGFFKGRIEKHKLKRKYPKAYRMMNQVNKDLKRSED